MKARLGVCSWSLQPTSPEDLAAKVRSAGLACVQLALDPLRTGEWPVERTVRELDRAGVSVRSGMMGTAGEDYSTLASIRATGGLRPDRQWKANLAAAQASARLANELRLPLVTFHAGFLPGAEPDGGRTEAERAKLLERLRQVADAFAAQGVALGLETGQETAATLLEALRELARPEVGVNFDPANMILYGMGDPVEALSLLRPRVKQIHVKDALPSPVREEWGTEVPAGAGAVGWKRFFEIARDLDVDLMIEREAGDRRVEDVRAARAVVRAHLPEIEEAAR